MIFELGRLKIFFIGVSVTFLTVLVNRFSCLVQSEVTDGEVIEITEVVGRKGKSYIPKILFYADKYEITFNGIINLDVDVKQKVKVIYNKKKPTDANVYSFFGFLFISLVYGTLFILLVLTPLVFSLINKNHYFQIDINKIGSNNFITRIEVNSI